jgi:hypothetical protein
MPGAAGALSTAGVLAGFFGAALRRAAGRFLAGAFFFAAAFFFGAAFFFAAVFFAAGLLALSPICVPSLAVRGFGQPNLRSRLLTHPAPLHTRIAERQEIVNRRLAKVMLPGSLVPEVWETGDPPGGPGG